ncbi:MAG TPA: methyltransferase domain-containing protein [Puia sp.]|nr:methyltransferase domain-containing protein [Puia sp.]
MEKQNVTTGFQNVDNAQHQFLAKFLEDAGVQPTVLEGFGIQLDRLDIKEGHHVLDVGCGIGLQAHEMAKLVGAGGRVVGTDLSTVMIDIAKSRAADSDLPLEFVVADALAQPFPDQSFDRIRTERVLMYIKDLPAVLKEFRRLLRSRGKIVIFDFDWDAMIISHRDKALTRKIVRYGSDSFPNGRVGSELFGQMRLAGFRGVRARPYSYSGNTEIVQSITKRLYEGIIQTGVSTGVFSREEIADWWKAFDEDGSKGDLFMSFTGFIVTGSKD